MWETHEVAGIWRDPRDFLEPSLSCSTCFLANAHTIHSTACYTLLASLSSWLFLLVPLTKLGCCPHLPPKSRKTSKCLLEVPRSNLRESHSVPLGCLILTLLSFHLSGCEMGTLKCHPPGVYAELYEADQGRAANTAELSGHLAVPLRRW